MHKYLLKKKIKRFASNGFFSIHKIISFFIVQIRPKILQLDVLSVCRDFFVVSFTKPKSTTATIVRIW
ncbi:hypothetical protein CW304_12095 [Bacillus sp. UFRGS-B20]|nr:hypothetical protein CW304_12095 [Bacillus sp. UFRGS-B20]